MHTENLSTVWFGENWEPSKVTFDELQKQTQEKNVQSRLPDERTVMSFWGMQVNVALCLGQSEKNGIVKFWIRI